MNIEFDAGEWAAKLAGVAGAFVSMRFLQGTRGERLMMAVSGAMLSFYAAPFAAHKLGMPEGLAGFLLGMFGMAIASRVWEWIKTTPLSIFTEWLPRRRKD